MNSSANRDARRDARLAKHFLREASIVHSGLRRRISMVHFSSQNPWEIIYSDFGQSVREQSLKSNVKTGSNTGFSSIGR